MVPPEKNRYQLLKVQTRLLNEMVFPTYCVEVRAKTCRREAVAYPEKSVCGVIPSKYRSLPLPVLT